MIFRMKSDVEFEANDIEDAFIKISKYFSDLTKDEETETIFIKGEIEISRKD